MNYEIIPVSKPRFRTNAQHTSNFVAVALGGFTIESVNVMNFVLTQCRAEITNNKIGV